MAFTSCGNNSKLSETKKKKKKKEKTKNKKKEGEKNQTNRTANDASVIIRS